MGIFSRTTSHKPTASARRKRPPLLPASVQIFLARRLTDGVAAVFLLSGAALFLALVSYHVGDPSLNTAAPATADVRNFLGKPGAYTADLLLQTLGLSAYLIACAPLVWGTRIFTRRPLGGFGMRIPLLLLSVLFGAVALARVPAFETWGIGAYMGGSVGGLIFSTVSGHLQGWLGVMAFTFVAVTAAVVCLAALIATLGITTAEWLSFLSTCSKIIAAATRRTIQLMEALHIWHGKYAGQSTMNPAVRHAQIQDARHAQMQDARRVQIQEDQDDATTAASRIETEGIIPEKRKPIVALRAEKSRPAQDDKQKKLNLRHSDEDWQLPQIDFLDDVPESTAHLRLDESALQKNAEMLQSTLSDFGVQGEILKVSPGPIITLYEMEPAPGTKTSRVIGLADDIARSMSAVSVRVAVVPGKNAIGIELPNAKRETVFLKELLSTRDYDKTQAKLPLVLGKNISGAPVIADLARMPHLLVAGTTGSGKSVAINTMILSLLYRLSPEQCRFIMIDPKMLELSVYDDIPHLLTPVVTEPHRAVTALKWAVREMEDRYRAMSKLGVRNLDGFNTRVREARAKGEVLTYKTQTGFDSETGKPVYEEQPIDLGDLPYIVVIVDEFADLMLVAGKDVENAIQRLAQMARAAGIHLIMATQRPSVDVITGVVKANFPTRISFQVTSKIDSRTILGDGGAETLLGQGDMLYMAAGGRITRVHGPFVSDEEVEKVAGFLKTQGVPDYIDGVTEDDDGGTGDPLGGDNGGAGDELYDHAVALILRERKVSTSFVQRHLQIGYNRAARLVERMEREGLVSAASTSGRREILVDNYGT